MHNLGAAHIFMQSSRVRTPTFDAQLQRSSHPGPCVTSTKLNSTHRWNGLRLRACTPPRCTVIAVAWEAVQHVPR